MPRSREKILSNLETVYRDAYESAKQAGDQARMHDLDASFQREQLLLEVLLDVRDALYTIGDSKSGESALEKINALRKLTRKL